MAQPTKASSISIKSKAMASTSGVMNGSMKDCGKITKCTARGYSPGPMAEDIRVSIIWIRRRERASLNGRMEGPMMGSGEMASRMGKGSISRKQGLLEKVYGRMARR